MSTPVFGLPFPTLGDTPNGPGAIQALAEGVDDALAATGLGGPLGIQRGSFVGSADSQGMITATFPQPFTGPPVVVAALGDTSSAAQVATLAGLPTSSGFTVRVEKSTGDPVSSGGFRIAYIAIGPV